MATQKAKTKRERMESDVGSALSAAASKGEHIPTEQEMRKTLILRQGRELTERFASATVAICGLGGLGSNIAVSLARSGIGKLLLYDFDVVDVTNLHRQQYKASQVGMEKTAALWEILKEIAPYTKVCSKAIKIDEHNAYELLQEADIICEAFDDPVCKAMLTEVVLSELPQKYYVAASGMAGLGSVNLIKTRQMTERFYLCGDGESDVAQEGTLFSSRVMACAAHQAHCVIRILAGKAE